MPERTLWIDTETDGLDPEQHDLLTIGCYLSAEGGVSEWHELAISRGTYRNTERALEVNRLDLDTLRKQGQPLERVDARMAALVINLKPRRIGGQNLRFDLGFIQAQLPRTWAALEWAGLLRHQIDTRQTAIFLRDAGLLPAGLSLSLESLCEHYGVQHGGHTAGGDAMSAAEVYEKMLEGVRK